MASHPLCLSMSKLRPTAERRGGAQRRGARLLAPLIENIGFFGMPGTVGPRQSATAELTFAARTILALDLDTTTSCALRGRDRLITSGTVSFRPGRHDGGGMRYPMMVAVDVKAVAALPASPRSFASHSRWTGCRCSSSAVGPGAIPEAPGNRDEDRLGAGVTGQHP